MNFPLYIAKRYIRSKSNQSAVNIINFITFLVIVIGSAALFIVLSAFAGLKTFSLQFSNTFDPDLKAIATTGKFFSLHEDDAKKLSEINGIANYSKEIEERVYLSFKEKNHIAYIKGVGENYRSVTGLDSTLYYGNWSDNALSVVAGRGVVNRLGIVTNSRDALKVITLKPGKSSLTADMLSSKSAYNQLSVNVSGVYAIEESLDNKYIIAELPLVQAFLEKNSTQISALGFKLSKNSNEEEVRAAVNSVLGDKVIVLNRRELNSTLYRMLNTENMATYLIFTLVLIIALFNVVGAIIMMILDKQQNLKTLYSLGTTLKELRRIYFVQGVLVTTLGGLMGVILGSLLIGSQIAFEWLMITPSLPYPVEYNIMNVLVVLATIIILGLLSSKIASSRISKELIAN
ncbi:MULTISPECIES: ABC transporter permease [Croceitalea]|uniref:FtsX-like permease family protein n=1 Tax=Croceitalea vernalis TaxID=3075599 RepID=A0ABU3BD90_9FLAO|nr:MULTISPECIES: FtsX-like permease family protein [unclassified Croceitalea]MDT0538653.1 FtsX-like permease family protein [Croceitalea sp. P059]MDT0620437.1 FtsX-like permease family protein [Croceitalea sp. P007]